MPEGLLAAVLAVAGLALLYYGADWLVDGASGLARTFGVSSFIIGMTVVALGTSAPELLVSIVASIQGKSGLVLGNILGSNLSNVGLILGVSAIIVPIGTDRSMLTQELPVFLLAALVFYAAAGNGFVARWEGLGLLAIFGVALWLYWKKAQKQRREYLFGLNLDDGAGRSGEGASEVSAAVSLFWVLAGIVALVAGAEALVRGAVALARMAGVSEEIIGFTLVALGTSLPELATSVTAAIRKEADMCVGNIIGSNIMNILLIGGVAAVIHPMAVTSRQLIYDFPSVIGISFLLGLFMRTGFKVSRAEGLALVAFYGLYLGLMFSGHLGTLGP